MLCDGGSWWGVKGEIDEKGFLAGYDKSAECSVVADAADRPTVACGREFEGVTCSGHRGVPRAGVNPSRVSADS